MSAPQKTVPGGSRPGFAKRLAASLHDRKGNVMMITAFAMIPMTFATGMAIDYSRAARMQTKMNALADAAALAAVASPMMSQSRSAACNAARSSFLNQMQGMQEVSFNNNNLEISITEKNVLGITTTFTCLKVITPEAGLAPESRTATVTYSADSPNHFAGVLGSGAIPIGGTSTTTAKIAPNIDFYLLIDSSGSMAFPSTSGGITQLRSLTGGCAFACHSTNDETARTKTGAIADYYTVATSYGIPLRIDEARSAVKSMMSTASARSTTNGADYRAALASFAALDTRANNYYTVHSSLTNNLSSVSTTADNIKTSLYYKNNCPTASYCNGDADTASSDAMTRMNTLIPTPGNGTKQLGDKPQATLFLVTDGMRDETRSPGRPEVAFDTALCTTLKNRNIRIGIIYTEYLRSSMDGDSWSQTNVVPYLSQVEPALTSCASPGLFFKVTTDDDISAALNKLFDTTISTARITN